MRRELGCPRDFIGVTEARRLTVVAEQVLRRATTFFAWENQDLEEGLVTSL